MKSFSDYYKERELNEMARRKKGKMYTPTAEKEDAPMVIKGKLGRIGHVPHQSGGGAHLDKRKRRLNTRGSQQRKAIREYD